MTKLKELNVLFLEDNIGFAKYTIELLNMYFSSVHHSDTIARALELFEDNRIDVIISDIKVNDGNGLDFITKVRESDFDVPIIILSAHKDEDFLFKAIPLNIMSYELKPLGYDNFMLLLKKLLLKFESKPSVSICDGIEYDFNNKEILDNGQSVKLSKKETLLLELIIKYKGSVVTKEMIQNIVWADVVMSEPALKNLIFRLRKKISKEIISTVQDIGYKLEVETKA